MELLVGGVRRRINQSGESIAAAIDDTAPRFSPGAENGNHFYIPIPVDPTGKAGT
ncbi:MAG: hypothetical protein IT447_07890 [Phycisphaerales bacterium]|jgi:hypothetical protein|nr:hypothetical protein [Phycisphaerales bacterium]